MARLGQNGDSSQVAPKFRNLHRVTIFQVLWVLRAAGTGGHSTVICRMSWNTFFFFFFITLKPKVE